MINFNIIYSWRTIYATRLLRLNSKRDYLTIKTNNQLIMLYTSSKIKM